MIRTTTQHSFKKDNTTSKFLLVGLLSVVSIMCVIIFIIMLIGGNLSSAQSPTQDWRLEPGYVSEQQFGGDWPFTVPEGVVLCAGSGVVVLETRSGTFGLTGYSNTAGFTNIKDSGIWKISASGWGYVPMSKFISYAVGLCSR